MVLHKFYYGKAVGMKPKKYKYHEITTNASAFAPKRGWGGGIIK